MNISELELQNFRNFHKFKIEFESSTVIYGPNASGKSSIIEAVNLLATGQSMRAGFDKEMILFGKEHARVAGRSEDFKLDVVIAKSEHAENLARKKFKVNGVAKQLNNFAGNFKCVAFTPTDLEIITDGPQVRRRYLDFILYQVSKEYRVSHTNLTKVIKNRNKVLEKICEFGQGHDQIGFWNDLLIKESEVIHRHRKNFFHFIKDRLNEHGKDLDPTCESLDIHYKTNEVTLDRLKEYAPKEIASKTTLLGPNRDDFSILLNKKEVSSFGSRGQQRAAVLSLKLSEIDFLEESSLDNQRPVLLLDDIFSELDHKHREQIMSIVKLQQTIITTADKHYLKELPAFEKVIDLEK